LWVRILLLSPRSLIAIAPLSRHAGDQALGVARLAVPRRFELIELAVDLTQDPTSEPGSDQTLAVRAAVGFARSAGTAERLQQWRGACGAWECCATYWSIAADKDREALALLYAAESAERAHLDDRAERHRRIAVEAGVGPLASREIPDPFLAEAVLPDAHVF